MKDTGKQLLSICSKIILFTLAAFPLLATIDYFTEGPFAPFEKYKHTVIVLWNIVTDNWTWLLVVIVTPILSRGATKIYPSIAEEIRQNMFEGEMIRWLNTPYISPLHHLYMIRPPRWLRWENNNPFRNDFYKFITQAFRDLIYRRYEYTDFTPSGERPNIWKVVPRRAWINIIIYNALPLLIVAALYYKNGMHIFEGYYALALPVIISLLARGVVVYMAIWDHASWRVIDRQIIESFGDPLPKTRWMDLYPNQPGGRVILDTWRSECRLRQDRDYQYRATGKLDTNTVPVTGPLQYAYDNPSLPLCPYPDEKIPEWAENYDSMYHGRRVEVAEKQQEELLEAAKESGGKVVPLDFKRRR